MKRKPETSNLTKRIGVKLKAIRMVQGLTQQEMAEKLDVSLAFAGELERGETDPSLKMLEKIASSLNLSVIELISDDQNKNDSFWNKRFEQLLLELAPEQRNLLYQLLVFMVEKK